MAEEATPSAPDHNKSTSADSSAPPKSIFLISYPKIVFLYPSLLTALFCGLFMIFSGAGDDLSPELRAAAVQAEPVAEAKEGAENAAEAPQPQRNQTAIIVSSLFLCVLGINLVVLSFDFPRTTSLTLFFFLAAAFTGAVLLFRSYPDILPAATRILHLLHPLANAHFYFIFSGFMVLIYVAVAINVQFDYWEVRPNELLHHHGILSDLKRYSAPHLRIDKEINDVFEYVLLRSGRLILQARGESRAIILENVFFINRKEAQLTRMLGALQVQVRGGDANGG